MDVVEYRFFVKKTLISTMSTFNADGPCLSRKKNLFNDRLVPEKRNYQVISIVAEFRKVQNARRPRTMYGLSNIN